MLSKNLFVFYFFMVLLSSLKKTVSENDNNKTKDINYRINDFNLATKEHYNLRILGEKKKIIKFIPWPHRDVFEGFLKNGTWITGQSKLMSNTIDNDFNNMDTIQTKALNEGIFKPIDKTFPKYHIFSSDEANSCIYGKTILFSGDSYMVQMFIGFSEILLDEPTNVEIISGKVRNEIYNEMTEKLDKLFGNKTKIKFLYYHCHLEDFVCAQEAMIADKSLLNKADVFITNIAIHYKALHINDPNMIENYSTELQNYFTKYKDMSITWATGPSYHKPTASSTILNLNSMEIATKNNIPFIDIYTLTDCCNWKNCSSDGGHRSRFVNRMKAQMFLNNICSIEYK